MKIAIVDLLFRWPPDGGARVDVFHLMKYLSDSHEVRLFFPRIDGDPFRRGEVEGVDDTIERLLFPVNVSTEEYLDHTVLGRLRERVNEFSPNKVIIGDGWHLKPYLIKIFSEYKPIVRLFAHEMLCIKGHGHRYRNEAPCDITYFDDGFDTCRECFKHWYKNTCSNVFDLDINATGLPGNSQYPEIVREALACSSAVVVYNQHEKERLEPYGKNVIVCTGGVEAKLFNRDIEHSEKRPKEKKWRFLVIGRCDDHLKGLHIVRDAVERLHANRIDNFDVVYTGTQEGSNGCTPLGWLARDRVIEEIQKSDITIHPSVWPEPFGIAAVESLALGTPIIASDHSGLRGIVRDTSGGWVFPAGDASALSNTMLYVMDHPEEVLNMSSTVRKTAKKHCWRHVFKTCYDPLLKSI